MVIPNGHMCQVSTYPVLYSPPSFNDASNYFVTFISLTNLANPASYGTLHFMYLLLVTGYVSYWLLALLLLVTGYVSVKLES